MFNHTYRPRLELFNHHTLFLHYISLKFSKNSSIQWESPWGKQTHTKFNFQLGIIMAIEKYFGPNQQLHIFQKRFDTFINNNHDVTKVKIS